MFLLMLIIGWILVIMAVAFFFNSPAWWLILLIPLFIIGIIFIIRAIRGRPHEVWDDIPSYEFQKSLNEERKSMGIPQRPEKEIEKYKKEVQNVK